MDSSNPRLASRLAGILRNDQFGFVATNLIANAIVLARSYVTMRALDYRDLGIVTAMQTIMLLVGTLQFGVVNGGYRLLCSADADDARSINNVAYSCFAIIALASLCLAMLFGHDLGAGFAIWVMLTGVGAGALTLVRSWVNNQMIAAQMLDLLNRITVWSAVLSLLPLLTIFLAPLVACILSVAVQPALFIATVLLLRPGLRPDRWSLSRSVLSRIFVAGFFIFLSGMLVQLNAQIERWYVVRYLGLDALGHLYLALLVVNLFSIVPNALQSLYLPRIIQAWDRREASAIASGMRQLMGWNVAYCAVAGLLLFTLAEPLIGLALPRYGGDLRYVYLIYPGLAIYSIGGAIAVIFNVLIRYRSYNVGFGAGTLFTIIAFGAGSLTGIRYSLVQVSLIKTMTYGLTGLIFSAGFWIVSREFGDFRFRLRAKGGQ